MRKISHSESGVFNPRVLLAFVLWSAGASLAVFALNPPTPSTAAAPAPAATQLSPLMPGETPRKLPVIKDPIVAVRQLLASYGAPNASKPGVARRSTAGTGPAAQGIQPLTPFVSEGVDATVSPPVRDLPATNAFSAWRPPRQERRLDKRTPQTPRHPLEADPVVQRDAATDAIPGVGVSFDGMNISNACGNCLPPDTVGAVGPNHYVQMVNSHFAIYSKAGATLVTPKPINSLWNSTPNSTCFTHNNGDPIVLYDQLADRWLLSQFTVQTGSENYAECIAISQTPDPTGAYWLYQFDESADTFQDYPHIGMWPDGYYMSTNLFPNDALLTSTGAGAWAFERPKMLLGQTARYLFFDLTPLADQTYTPGGQLPATLEGKTLPPAGSPNYFLEVSDANVPNTPPATGLHDEMRIWKFHVDWTTPANSTFGTGSSAPAPKPGFSGLFAGNAGQPNFIVPIADYVANACLIENSANDCVPQKFTSGQPPQYLDVLGDRLMFRLVYRNFGDHEALVVNHTANVLDETGGAARAGVRWYEFRNLSTTPTAYQQGTFAPLDPASIDGPLWRWMGSAAIDASGNIALGYSASGPNYFPSLHYAGRLATDPLNQMAQGEAVMFVGQGVEVQTGFFPFRNRWGDYSNLTVDPTDDCTFWYTNEYLFSTNTDILPVDWRTRIGSFKFPTCVAAVPTPISAVSRKTHGAAGPFDINLLSPIPEYLGIECRKGQGANSDEHQVVITFAAPAIVASATCDGTPASASAAGNDIVVNCTGVPNAKVISIDLTGVTVGGSSGNVSVPMGVLLGDVTFNKIVSNTDVSAVKTQVSSQVTASNFQTDVTANGIISNTDVSTTKAQVSTTLP